MNGIRMDLMAAHHTSTTEPVLYEYFKKIRERLKAEGIDDPYGHKTAQLIYYKYIEGNSYYEQIYNTFVNGTLKHNEDSLKVHALIKEMGYRYFVKAFDRVLKLEHNGKTENFPKGKD